MSLIAGVNARNFSAAKPLYYYNHVFVAGIRFEGKGRRQLQPDLEPSEVFWIDGGELGPLGQPRHP